MERQSRAESKVGDDGIDEILPIARYCRHKPEETPLYPLIQNNLATFFETMEESNTSLPRFVRREFEAYLRCGMLEHGFIRVKCNGCRHEHLVAFSCKCRGFCPSCAARRMIDTAAHLTDHVVPHQPSRQWVLTFPYPLRMLLASRPQALTGVLATVTRAIETHLIHQAGLTRSSGARTGIVTFVQRFGSALNLNVHLHMIILDGVYTFDSDGHPRFHAVAQPDLPGLDRLLHSITRRILKKLERAGLLIQEPGTQPYLDLQPEDAHDHLSAAAVRYRIAIGPAAGQRTFTIRSPTLAREPPPKHLTIDRNGFSLNAAVACRAHAREKLERVCRYVARPAIALDRLSTNHSGQVVYELKRPFSDGTTHFVFQPTDFLARLAALVPRPRAHLTRYHGVFAPNFKHRKRIVPKHAEAETAPASRKKTQSNQGNDSPESQPNSNQSSQPTAPLSWAERLKRVFEIDVTICPFCGGNLRVIADITQPDVINKILNHLNRKASTTRAPPRRNPPRNPPVSSNVTA